MQVSTEARNRKLIAEREKGATYIDLGKRFKMTATHARRVYLIAQAAKGNRKARVAVLKMQARKK